MQSMERDEKEIYNKLPDDKFNVIEAYKALNSNIDIDNIKGMSEVIYLFNV